MRIGNRLRIVVFLQRLFRSIRKPHISHPIQEGGVSPEVVEIDFKTLHFKPY
jgi:hypothetical protein